MNDIVHSLNIVNHQIINKARVVSLVIGNDQFDLPIGDQCVQYVKLIHFLLCSPLNY